MPQLHAIVNTPQQLLDAVEAGARHIEIQSHLDLTSIDPAAKQMMKGNCSTPPSARDLGLSDTSLSQWRQGQAVIVTDKCLLDVEGNMWLHQLFIRHRTTQYTDTSSVIKCCSFYSFLWITAVSMQGSGKDDPPYGALNVSGGAVYAKELRITHFCSDISALWVSNGATVTLGRGVFVQNSISKTFSNSAIVSINAVDPTNPSALQQDTVLRLKQCDIYSNSAPRYVAVETTGKFYMHDAHVYSDIVCKVHYTKGYVHQGRTEPLNDAPASRPGISSSSPWFLNVQIQTATKGHNQAQNGASPAQGQKNYPDIQPTAQNVAAQNLPKNPVAAPAPNTRHAYNHPPQSPTSSKKNSLDDPYVVDSKSFQSLDLKEKKDSLLDTPLIQLSPPMSPRRSAAGNMQPCMSMKTSYKQEENLLDAPSRVHRSPRETQGAAVHISTQASGPDCYDRQLLHSYQSVSGNAAPALQGDCELEGGVQPTASAAAGAVGVRTQQGTGPAGQAGAAAGAAAAAVNSSVNHVNQQVQGSPAQACSAVSTEPEMIKNHDRATSAVNDLEKSPVQNAAAAKPSVNAVAQNLAGIPHQHAASPHAKQHAPPCGGVGAQLRDGFEIQQHAVPVAVSREPLAHVREPPGPFSPPTGTKGRQSDPTPSAIPAAVPHIRQNSSPAAAAKPDVLQKNASMPANADAKIQSAAQQYSRNASIPVPLPPVKRPETLQKHLEGSLPAPTRTPSVKPDALNHGQAQLPTPAPSPYIYPPHKLQPIKDIQKTPSIPSPSKPSLQPAKSPAQGKQASTPAPHTPPAPHNRPEGLQHSSSASSSSIKGGASTLDSNPSNPNTSILRVTSSKTEQDTSNMSFTVATLLPPPKDDATADDKMDFLHQQLDSVGTDKPAINDLVMMGCGDRERIQGGQAIVQMARSKNSGLEYAIKFFISCAAFVAEEGMYRKGSGAQVKSCLSQFLPQVNGVYSNRDKALKDAHGYPLPPCIVMERGESLDLWAARAKPDRAQAFTMMLQLATRLKDLHALGYVHRDIKPANVMWLPRENRWTIIDFGCVACTGESAKLGFSIVYAAPEVIAAYRRGSRTIVVDPSMDVWSLGVIAFELLTGKPALSVMEGKDKVMDRIEGTNGLKLPWEGSNLTTENRRKLGVFKGSVLSLLSRDPVNRPSMQKFCESCDRVLAGTTTVVL